jgi:hypothetical protein
MRNHHYNSNYYAGLNLPPWYTAVPALTPLGLADWAGTGIGQKARGGSFFSSPVSSSFDWSGVAKVGLVVGGVVGIYFLYRSVRGAARTSVSALRGAAE